MKPSQANQLVESKLRTYEGATSIITGGASGIGRALAEELANRGSEVVIADLQDDEAEKVAASIRANAGKACAVKLDVRNADEMQYVVESTVKRTGRLDYIFNNAGIRIDGNAIHYGIDDWNFIIDVNLRGVINGVHAAFPIMVKQGFGHIVNVSSLAGLIPYPGGPGYAATKHAIVGLSYSLQAEAAAKGVRVSVMCPGLVRTPLLKDAGKFGRMLVYVSPERQTKSWESMRPMCPNTFARKSLDRVAKNKTLIIVPSTWKLVWLVYRLLPSFAEFLARIGYQINQKKLGRNEA